MFSKGLEEKDSIIKEIKSKKEECEKILKENISKISDLENTNSTLKREMTNLISDLENKTELAEELARLKEELTSLLKTA